MKVLLSGVALLAMSIVSYASDGLNDDLGVTAPTLAAAAVAPVADSTTGPNFTPLDDEGEPAAVVPDCGTAATLAEDLTVEPALSANEIPASEDGTCGTCSASSECVGLTLGASCGEGASCIALLGTMCSDHQTWRCFCYSGAFP